MAAFTDFTNILPDPVNTIGLAGQADASGTAGAGFASVQHSSKVQLQIDRTKSNIVGVSEVGYHKWNLNIGYNELTCPEFHSVYAFLLQNSVSLEPFYVLLPQYTGQSITNKTVSSGGDKDTTTITVSGTGVTVGAMFNELNHASHKKVYIVTRVETETDYFSPEGSPGAGNERLHVYPAFEENVTTTLNFTDPLMRVKRTGDLTHSIKSDGLINFSLSLGEV
jgi:hypothetical protein